MGVDVKHCVLATIVLAAGAACSDDEGSPVDPTAAGRGGSSGSAGRGGSAGTSGAAGFGGGGGTLPDGGVTDGGLPDGSLPDGGLPRIVASLDGDAVILSSLDEVWIQTCSNTFQVVRREGDAWTPLRDDRPEARNLQVGAHYLDGTFIDACRLSLGCDVGTCAPLSRPLESYQLAKLVAREYVSVGQAAAPTCEALDAGAPLDGGAGAGVRQLPDVETRVPEGALGVSVRFYRNASCDAPPVTLVVPVE